MLYATGLTARKIIKNSSDLSSCGWQGSMTRLGRSEVKTKLKITGLKLVVGFVLLVVIIGG
jgi:hypothetical protein